MTSFKKLQITYADPNDLEDAIQVDYKLRNTPVTAKWVERVCAAQEQGYQIDDPARFYGFGTLEEQQIKVLTEINGLIKTLNQWTKIDIKLDFVDEQDKLNQLHHIFEIEHGLLDEKNPDSNFKQHLSKLNLLVHRCESVARGARPRHVVTYFGLPKTKTLNDEDYKYFESKITSGTIYINYAQIGKTLTDLMLDNDSYIQPDAFQPFRNYSADFVVRFWNADNLNLKDNLYRYYILKDDYFKSLGYSWEQLSKSIGSIPVADLCYKGDILKQLETRQFVKAVHFL
jgi:hypothetical protein